MESVMAHGSKKWIRDCNGRIKRSSDRTYKDKLGDIRNFNYDYQNQYGIRHGSPCPQCKAVRKDIREHKKLMDRLRKNEGSPRYQEAYAEWQKNPKKSPWNRVSTWTFVPQTDFFDRSRFWDEFWKEKGIDTWMSRMPLEGMLCRTCVREYRIKFRDSSRHRWYDDNRIKGWQGVILNQEYRAEVKAIMRAARYDEDLYDAIPDYKNNSHWRFD
jgi:hypothetical protein